MKLALRFNSILPTLAILDLFYQEFQFLTETLCLNPTPRLLFKSISSTLAILDLIN